MFNYISYNYTTSDTALIIITIVIKISVIKLVMLKLTTSKDLLKDVFIIICKIKTLDITALINIKYNKYNFINTAVTQKMCDML